MVSGTYSIMPARSLSDYVMLLTCTFHRNLGEEISLDRKWRYRVSLPSLMETCRNVKSAAMHGRIVTRDDARIYLNMCEYYLLNLESSTLAITKSLHTSITQFIENATLSMIDEDILDILYQYESELFLCIFQI